MLMKHFLPYRIEVHVELYSVADLKMLFFLVWLCFVCLGGWLCSIYLKFTIQPAHGMHSGFCK